MLGAEAVTGEITIAVVVTCRGGSEDDARAHAAALIGGWAAHKQAKPGEWQQAEEFTAAAPDGMEISMQAAWIGEADAP